MWARSSKLKLKKVIQDPTHQPTIDGREVTGENMRGWPGI